jgi:hypothetical protein
MKNSVLVWTIPPHFSSSILAPPTVHGTRRTVFIGGSNLGKIAKAAAESGSAVVDLTDSGWSHKPGNIKKIADVLKNLQLQPCNTIVIDAMANSAYLGTDENGLPMPPVKSKGIYSWLPPCFQDKPETS